MRIAAQTEVRWRPVGSRRISAKPSVGRLDVAVAAGENSYANFYLFAAHFDWYGADPILVCEHCACRDGKRLRRTRRLLRKSHSQWGASRLLSNDGGSSPIAIWHARSRLSQWMRHSSH